MPSSESATQRRHWLPEGEDPLTWIATAALALLVYLVGFVGYVPVQAADGTRRWIRILTLMHLAWDTYPAEAPVFLSRAVLLLLVVLAVPVGAYLVVACWRLRP